MSQDSYILNLIIRILVRGAKALAQPDFCNCSPRIIALLLGAVGAPRERFGQGGWKIHDTLAGDSILKGCVISPAGLSELNDGKKDALIGRADRSMPPRTSWAGRPGQATSAAAIKIGGPGRSRLRSSRFKAGRRPASSADPAGPAEPSPPYGRPPAGRRRSTRPRRCGHGARPPSRRCPTYAPRHPAP